MTESEYVGDRPRGAGSAGSLAGGVNNCAPTVVA